MVIEVVRRNSSDLLYSVSEAAHPLVAHKSIPGVESRYWEVMDPETVPMFECYERNKFVVRIGNIDSFDVGDIAQIAELGFGVYLNEGAFNGFPKDDVPQREALFAKMLSGFNKRQTFVSVYDSISKKVVGGTIVNAGIGTRSIRKAVGQEDSQLATLYSYKFPQKLLPKGLQEDEVVCLTRFWRASDTEIAAMVPRQHRVLYTRWIVQEILSGLARASVYALDALGKEYKLGIFDTTDPRIMNSVRKNYGAIEITNQPKTTKAVRDPNPLHWHFDMPGQIGVFVPNIQLALADAVDRTMGEKEVVDWKAYKKRYNIEV